MARSYSYSKLIGELGLGSLLDELRDTSAARDQDRSHPFEQFAKLKASRFGAVRLPTAIGGRDASLVDLFAAIFDLATADSSVAHALRNHFSFVETALRLGPGSRLWSEAIPKVAEGGIIGWAVGEPVDETSKKGRIHRGGGFREPARLAPSGNGWRLDGKTFYSTGNIYADYLFVTALDETDTITRALISTGREGVEILEDWDGIGQRSSGSGSTRFNAVGVTPADVIDRVTGANDTLPPYTSSFTQLFLTTVVAGIVTGAVAEATSLVAERRSNYYHGLHDLPSREIEIQMAAGELSAEAFAARSAVLSAAASQQQAWEITGGNDDPAVGEQARHRASVDTIKAKVFVDAIAQKVTSRVFDLLSGSSVLNRVALDRHWRNARTVSSHNPSLYKARILGDYEINGTPTPSGLFF